MVRWETNVGPNGAQYFFHGDPYVTADTIVIGADAQAGGGVHAFVLGTGRERWRVSISFGVNGPMAGIAHRAFAYAPRQAEILSFDVDSGELRWRVAARVPGFEGPGVLGNRVFAGTDDGLLQAMNAETGRQEWSARVGAAVTTSVSAFADGVYAGAADGMIVRVDPESGSVLGSRKVDEKLRPRSVLVRSSNTLLVLLTNETADYLSLVSLDPKLETIRWRQAATKNWSTSRAFVWKNTVILGTSSGELTSYCLGDGTKGWSYTVRGSVRSIGGSDDALYVTTQGGSLYALRPTEVACGAK
jgi:outer membrane protein assembly factor BamB